MLQKECTQCHITKPLIDFCKQKRGLFGVHSECRKCFVIRKTKYRHSKKVLISSMYDRQVRKSRQRKHPMPTYTRDQLIDWCMSQQIFHKLFDKWKDSEFDKMMSPSCDRTDDYKGYSFDRLQLMTWAENYKKGNDDAKSGINNKRNKKVIGTHKITGEVVMFHSQREADRQLGICFKNISACCLEKEKSAGGYIWKFD